MVDFTLREHIGAISEEQAAKCQEYINEVIELSNIARKYGLLELEESVIGRDNTDFFNVYLKKLILLITDGTDPELVKEIADILILMSFKDGWELLVLLIIKQGVLGIQYGENPRIIEEKVNAWLGLENLVEKDNQFGIIDDETEDDLMEFFDFSDLPD